MAQWMLQYIHYMGSLVQKTAGWKNAGLRSVRHVYDPIIYHVYRFAPQSAT